jgi:uncharacterized protein (TIGR03086 family)
VQEPEVFILAQEALKRVIAQIRADQWEIQIPPGMTRRPATLREAVNYHAYDDAWVPDVLAGKTIEEVGEAHDGDLLGDDPIASYIRYNEQASAAVRDFHDLERVVHLSYGDFPARTYLQHTAGYRGFRVWDLARLIGVDSTLPPELVQGLWDVVMPHAEQWRAMGIFGPAITVSEDADAQTKLLALAGREA